MRPDTTLNEQLRDWASAVAGNQVQRTTATGTERIDVAAGAALFAANAMRLESIVQRMEQSGRWKEARVLRTEYCMAGLSEADRLARLARLGLRISRASYYSYLASAHAFVAGALSVGQDIKVA